MNKLDEIFNSMEDTVEISFCDRNCDNKRVFVISWSEKGRGFGDYTIFEDKKGIWRLDNESDSKEAVKRIFGKLIDKLPLIEYMTDEEIIEAEKESEEYLKNTPYFEEKETLIRRKYNPQYGDDRVCICGHPYYRHFDTYDNMRDVGCKYCGCGKFVERPIDNDIGK